MKRTVLRKVPEKPPSRYSPRPASLQLGQDQGPSLSLGEGKTAEACRSRTLPSPLLGGILLFPGVSHVDFKSFSKHAACVCAAKAVL